MKRTSSLFVADRVSVKLDSIEAMSQTFVQATHMSSLALCCLQRPLCLANLLICTHQLRLISQQRSRASCYLCPASAADFPGACQSLTAAS